MGMTFFQVCNNATNGRLTEIYCGTLKLTRSTGGQRRKDGDCAEPIASCVDLTLQSSTLVNAEDQLCPLITHVMSDGCDGRGMFMWRFPQKSLGIIVMM